jgi:hypothetical protein
VSKHTRQQPVVQHDFGKVLGKNLKAGFFGDVITDSGGVQLVVEVEKGTGLVDSFAQCIPDWRTGPVGYSVKHLVAQRVTLITAGYEDAIDSTLKRSDMAFSLALVSISGNPNLACQSTITIFENKITEAVCNALADWFLRTYVEKGCKDNSEPIVLDLDGSSVEAHGDQEKTAYNGYYETNMYFPLFVYDQYGWLIACKLRPGNESEDVAIVGELKRIVPQLRAKWPNRPIIVRADAGVYHPGICDWCEDNDVFYLMRFQGSGHGGGSLATSSDSAAEVAMKDFRKRFGREKYLDSKISKSRREAEIKQIKDKKKRREELRELRHRHVRVYTEFMHRTGKGGNDKKAWRQERLVLCAVTHDDWGSQRTFFVTNISNLGPMYLIDELYNQRGEAELFIRAMKEIKCTRLSCQSFVANQFRLFLHGLAYLLLLQLKRLLPPSIRHLSIASIQKYIIRLPARITQVARDFMLRWSETFPWKNQLLTLCKRLEKLQYLRR